MTQPSNQPSPIEDTNLKCPWCGYNMTALTTNLCPECGKRFVLAKPGIEGRDYRSFKVSSSSMTCRECGHITDGFMPRQCAHCGKPFTLTERVFGTHFLG
jgi:primosomal protein N'